MKWFKRGTKTSAGSPLPDPDLTILPVGVRKPETQPEEPRSPEGVLVALMEDLDALCADVQIDWDEPVTFKAIESRHRELSNRLEKQTRAMRVGFSHAIWTCSNIQTDVLRKYHPDPNGDDGEYEYEHLFPSSEWPWWVGKRSWIEECECNEDQQPWKQAALELYDALMIVQPAFDELESVRKLLWTLGNKIEARKVVSDAVGKALPVIEAKHNAANGSARLRAMLEALEEIGEI